MPKVIRATTKSKGFTVGMAVAAVMVVVVWNTTHTLPLLVLLAAIAGAGLIDAIWYRPPRKQTEDVLEIRDEI